MQRLSPGLEGCHGAVLQLGMPGVHTHLLWLYISGHGVLIMVHFTCQA